MQVVGGRPQLIGLEGLAAPGGLVGCLLHMSKVGSQGSRTGQMFGED